MPYAQAFNFNGKNPLPQPMDERYRPNSTKIYQGYLCGLFQKSVDASGRVHAGLDYLTFVGKIDLRNRYFDFFNVSNSTNSDQKYYTINDLPGINRKRLETIKQSPFTSMDDIESFSLTFTSSASDRDMYHLSAVFEGVSYRIMTFIFRKKNSTTFKNHGYRTTVQLGGKYFRLASLQVLPEPLIFLSRFHDDRSGFHLTRVDYCMDFFNIAKPTMERLYRKKTGKVKQVGDRDEEKRTMYVGKRSSKYVHSRLYNKIEDIEHKMMHLLYSDYTKFDSVRRLEFEFGPLRLKYLRYGEEKTKESRLYMVPEDLDKLYLKISQYLGFKQEENTPLLYMSSPNRLQLDIGDMSDLQRTNYMRRVAKGNKRIIDAGIPFLEFLKVSGVAHPIDIIDEYYKLALKEESGALLEHAKQLAKTHGLPTP